MGVQDDCSRAYEDGVSKACKVIAAAIRAWNAGDTAGDGNGASDSMVQFIAKALDEAGIGANGYIFLSIVNDTPMGWKEVTEARYDEMLGILPPATMTGYGFCVGEAWDHHPIKGHPRYAPFLCIGSAHRAKPDNRFFEGTRPIGVKDFRNLDMTALGRELSSRPVRLTVTVTVTQEMIRAASAENGFAYFHEFMPAPGEGKYNVIVGREDQLDGSIVLQYEIRNVREDV